VSRTVVVDIQHGEEWRPVGSVSEDEPPGSISSHGVVREVYLFGWIDSDGPCLWRSKAGVDIENPAVREVHSTGLDRLADLTLVAHEIDWSSPTGRRGRLRFRSEQLDA